MESSASRSGRAIKIIGMAKLLEIKRTISPVRDKDLEDIKQMEKLESARGKREN